MKLRNERRVVLTALALLMAAPAAAMADWRVDEGVAIVEPTQTNANIELLAISCGDPVMVEVYARGGAVQPDGKEVQADYFYKPGKVRAVVDGKPVALVAAGSDGAVVLFAEGEASASYMAPVTRTFAATLAAGKQLSLEFDITPEKGKGGSAFETMAVFPLNGAKGALDEALRPCGQ